MVVTMLVIRWLKRSSKSLLAILFIIAVGTTSAPNARAVTPESPEVKAVIEKGLTYIAANVDSRLGGKCLAGIAFLKNGRKADDPVIKAALEDCRAKLSGLTNEDNYSLGAAIIFLCELDPQQHRSLIEKYLAEVLQRQMSIGSWSYAGYATGDTSQTQYAVLGMWMAQRHGFQIPLKTVEGVTSWLMRTQDVGGGWGYQGIDPGNYQRTTQSNTTQSLSAAGLGSLYVCADLISITEGRPADKKDEAALPSVLKEVKTVDSAKAKPTRMTSQVIDSSAVRQAMLLGNQWFSKNYGKEAPDWQHYYLYAYERYRSYQELALGKAEKEPSWYNEGYDLLKKTQQPDGSWQGQDNSQVATVFAVLYLSRSSRKAISKVVADWGGEGVLIGGMGLPTNTADLRERDGQLVQAPLSGSIDELLSIVENANNPDLGRLVDAKQELVLDADVTKRTSQLERLRALVSAGSYQSRIVAVRTLGRVRELDNVPLLIYALTDPDPRIVREADRGLRFISRKLLGGGVPDSPTQQQLREIQAGWKAWFTSIRPDAEFLD